MGQGQAEVAMTLLHECSQSGEWLCLKNLHLVTAWLPTLEKVKIFLVLWYSDIQHYLKKREQSSRPFLYPLAVLVTVTTNTTKTAILVLCIISSKPVYAVAQFVDHNTYHLVVGTHRATSIWLISMSHMIHRKEWQQFSGETCICARVKYACWLSFSFRWFPLIWSIF